MVVTEGPDSWGCDNCGAANSLDDELGLCRKCGQLASDAGTHDSTSPPRGISLLSSITDNGDTAGYREDAALEHPGLAIEQTETRVTAGVLGLLVTVAAVGLRASSRWTT